MILGFKQQFRLKIVDGRKIHTIREDKHNRWVPGRKIHMATGVRTPNMDIFAMNDCKVTQRITFIWGNYLTLPNTVKIFVDQKLLSPEVVEQLAKNDGFETTEEFLKWEGWYQKDFVGKLIHWTEKKY